MNGESVAEIEVDLEPGTEDLVQGEPGVIPGYNVYTLQQASRRSWRIGQKQDVDVYFLGYADTAQITCLTRMAKKIAVSQSTSGDMPDTGLDVLNQDGDSIEVALAKQLIA